MFASGIQLFFPKVYNSFGENGDEIENFKLGRIERTGHRIWIVHRGKLSEECSLLIVDLIAEEHYAYGGYVAGILNPCCAV